MLTVRSGSDALHVSVETTDFEEWDSSLTESFIPLATRPSAEDDFRGSLVALSAGDVAVMRATSVPQIVSRNGGLCRRRPTGMVGVLIQRRGQYAVESAGTQAIGVGNTVTFADLDSPYAVAASDEWTADAFAVSRDRIGPAPQLLARARNGPVQISSGPGEIFASTVDQLMTRLDDCALHTALRLLDASVDMFRIVIGDLEVPDAPADVMYHAAINWVRRHLDDPELNPDRVAAAVGVSLRHLHRVFSTFGLTVAGAIRTERLARVRVDLRDPLLRRQTIAALGVRSGLPDPAGLSRMFRREFGMSPREYRMSGMADHELPGDSQAIDVYDLTSCSPRFVERTRA